MYIPVLASSNKFLLIQLSSTECFIMLCNRVVKLTSPNLNYVIVFGAIMLLIGNIFLPFPSRNITLISIFCTVSILELLSVTLIIIIILHCHTALVQMARIFLSIGYDICFVVALVKTVRVAYIFRNVTPNKKVHISQCACVHAHQSACDCVTTLLIFLPCLESTGLAPLASLCWHHLG